MDKDIYYRFGCVESTFDVLNYDSWCNKKININDNGINSYGPFKLCENATTNGKTEEKLNAKPKEGKYDENASFEVYTDEGKSWRSANFYLIKVGWYNETNKSFSVETGVNLYGNEALTKMEVYGTFYKLDPTKRAYSLLKVDPPSNHPGRRLTPPKESTSTPPQESTSTPPEESTCRGGVCKWFHSILPNIWFKLSKKSKKLVKKLVKKSLKKSLKKSKKSLKKSKKSLKKSLKKSKKSLKKSLKKSKKSLNKSKKSKAKAKTKSK
jgi:hypothetical protein